MRNSFRHALLAGAVSLSLTACEHSLAAQPAAPVDVDSRRVVEGQTVSLQGLDPTSAQILAMHNQARAEVGVAPLTWDSQLAAAAQAYAEELARLGRVVHSPRAGRENQRENIASGPRGAGEPAQFIQTFVNEKRYFVPGLFPDVSTTGDWQDVSHYTQMVWHSTTHVGCGTEATTATQYVVCRYSPPGNRDGERVFP